MISGGAWCRKFDAASRLLGANRSLHAVKGSHHGGRPRGAHRGASISRWRPSYQPNAHADSTLADARFGATLDGFKFYRP